MRTLPFHGRRRAGHLAASLAIVFALMPLPSVRALGARPPQPPAVVASPAPALRPDAGQLDPAEAMPRYRIVATVNLADAILHGQEEVTLHNPGGAPMDVAVFRLLPNARPIYGGGSLTVERVERDGREVAFDLADGDTTLRVPLTPPLPPGGSTSLHLTFSGVIPRHSSGYAIYHHSAAVTSLAAWYPVLAPYDGGWRVLPVATVGDVNLFDPAHYDVTLRVARGYTVVSGGVVADRYDEGDATVWRLVSGPSRDLAIAISDRFVRYEGAFGGVAVNYYALAPVGGAASAATAFQIALDAFGTYVERFGDYPYEELDVVETPVSIGGYEFAGMVFIRQATRTQGSFSQLRFLVAHEVAHQWWFAQVGSDPVHEPWLDESLATYATALYLEDRVGAQAAAGMVSYFRQQGGGPAGARSAIASPSTAFGSWATYRRPVYYQGAEFLAELRREMGDGAFFALLRRYVEAYRFRTATTADFLTLAEEVAGVPLGALYERWFGTATPGR